MMRKLELGRVLDRHDALAGEITRKVTVRGLGVTKGARAAIEAAGGSIADNE